MPDCLSGACAKVTLTRTWLLPSNPVLACSVNDHSLTWHLYTIGKSIPVPKDDRLTCPVKPPAGKRRMGDVS
jgi:hypothetical protein